MSLNKRIVNYWHTDVHICCREWLELLNRRGVVIMPDEFGPYWLELLEKTDLNVLGIHPVGVDGKSPYQVLEAFLTDENRREIDRLEDRGIHVEVEMHSLSWLLPREEFAAHPAWFRMNEEGERVSDFNLCVSSAEALEIISQNAARLAKLYRPRSNRYYFWLDDVADSKCHCPECQKLSASDAALMVYNAILRGLRLENPEALQCYLAYHDTLEVPKTVRPEKGIFLEYAPMIRDFDRALNDPESEKNRKQVASLPALLSFFGTENAQALDYWLDNSLFSGWKKPPKPFSLHKETLAKDVAYYESLGIDSVTCFACYLGEEYYNLYGQKPDIAGYARVLSGKAGA